MLSYYKIFFCFSCLFLFSLSAQAKRVDQVLITGNKMVEQGAIRSKISFKKGDKYRVRKVRQDVQQIFKTGWFDQVEVRKYSRKNKVTLIYSVQEKPVVAKITYKGNKNLSKKDLEEVFTFSTHEFLSHKKLKSAIKDLQKGI